MIKTAKFSQKASGHQRWMLYLAHHRHALYESLDHLRKSKLTTLFIILVLGIGIALPVGFGILVKTSASWLNTWDSAQSATVFLKSSASQEDAMGLIQRLRNNPMIESIQFVDKQSALAELESLAGLSELSNTFTNNPLPHALIVKPKAKTLDTELIAWKNTLSKDPLVDMVQLDIAWIARAAAALNLLKTIALIISGILCVAVIFIVSNTIRMSIAQKQDEIHIVKLMGATDAFVRRPYLYSALWYGLLSSLVAFIIVGVGLMGMGQPLSALARAYQTTITLPSLGILDCMIVLFTAIILSWLAALFTTEQYLRKTV